MILALASPVGVPGHKGRIDRGPTPYECLNPSQWILAFRGILAKHEVRPGSFEEVIKGPEKELRARDEKRVKRYSEESTRLGLSNTQVKKGEEIPEISKLRSTIRALLLLILLSEGASR